MVIKKAVKLTENNIVIYQSKNGAIELRKDAQKDTLWATQAQMASIFGVRSQAITKHLKNIYRENELNKISTCSKLEQVQFEGIRSVNRIVEIYNLDAIISVGYRINSKMGTKFRQWSTKVLHSHNVDGFTINKKRLIVNYESFLKAVEDVKNLLPLAGSSMDNKNVLELVTFFADTWFSLNAFDNDTLISKGSTTKRVSFAAEKLSGNLKELKNALIAQGQASDLFGIERVKGTLEGIIGNVMQSFGGNELYPSIEEKAAHLLYFIIKNHPFVDGNKRSGAYSFVFFLRSAGVLDTARLTPSALTALTLLIAESDPKQKDKMIKLILTV